MKTEVSEAMITIEHPSGYEPIAFRPPRIGEVFFAHGCVARCERSLTEEPMLIIAKIHSREPESLSTDAFG